MTMTQYLCRIATTLMFFGALFGSQAAMAKDWPTQPIRIVRIPLMADSDSIPIADSIPCDGGHAARVS